MKIERPGSYLAYIYLLRVPLLIWIFLVAFPWVAVPRHAPAGSLLRGIFDISGRSEPLSILCALSFFLVTLASLLAAAAIGLTARLILLDGEERFGTGHIPRRPGVRLMYRLIPLLVPFSLLVGVCVETYTSSDGGVGWWAAALGIPSGVAVFVFVMRPLHDALWDRVILQKTGNSGFLPESFWNWAVPPTTFVLELAVLPLALSPEGYEDPITHELRDRHRFAAIQLTVSLFFYGLLFALKTESGVGTEPPVIPTLCLIIVLAMLLCWFLSALTFFFDRFRVPLLLIVAVYGWLVSGLPQGDHFYPAEPLSKQPALLTPTQVLQRRAGKTVVLVAASGGGIQAEAWSARVLSGLKQDMEGNGQGSEFDHSIVLISSVSGGSVGTMFFVDAYRDDGTLPPVGPDLDNYPPVKAAEVSSLDEVTWGMVYPDLVWSLAPVFKGVSVRPPHLLNGPNITSDRGTAIEKAWKLSPTIEKATLAKWQEQTAVGAKPAVIFNATEVESGDRFLLSTSSLGTGPSSENYDKVGRRVFSEVYPGFDVPIVTAARLSATFPFVTPAARIWKKDVFAKDNHIVDGGYYDNYGVATLVEWLDNALTNADQKPSKVIIVQIRDSATGVVKAPSRHGGWFFQTLQPLETLESVRGTAQFSRNEVAMDFVTKHGLYGIPIETVEFEYRGGADAPADVPLSWHLTAADKRALHEEWLSPRIVGKRSDFKRLMQ